MIRFKTAFVGFILVFMTTSALSQHFHHEHIEIQTKKYKLDKVTKKRKEIFIK